MKYDRGQAGSLSREDQNDRRPWDHKLDIIFTSVGFCKCASVNDTKQNVPCREEGL